MKKLTALATLATSLLVIGCEADKFADYQGKDKLLLETIDVKLEEQGTGKQILIEKVPTLLEATGPVCQSFKMAEILNISPEAAINIGLNQNPGMLPEEKKMVKIIADAVIETNYCNNTEPETKGENI